MISAYSEEDRIHELNRFFTLTLYVIDHFASFIYEEVRFGSNEMDALNFPFSNCGTIMESISAFTTVSWSFQ